MSAATTPDQGPFVGRLLVVDDNEMNRDMLSRRLSKRGHTVSVAEGGEEALEMIEGGDFDVILLDIMMPGIDGYETLERIRKEHGAGDLPVIMATAKDQSEDIVAALKKGANDYVTKPFDFPVVVARVQTQLALRRSRQALAAAHERMKTDLDAAARIQQTFLPVGNPSVDGAQLAWSYVPCDELAGDTLNIIPLDERHVACFVIDVSGHGVPSALLSVTLSRLMSPAPGAGSILVGREDGEDRLHIASPVEVADTLAQRFPYNPETRQYFTLVYGVLDLEEKIFRYVSAGHPPLIQVSEGGAPSLHASTGPPVGLMPASIMPSVFTEGRVGLASGDRLYLYSDGIPETSDPDDEDELGEERTAEILAVLRGVSLEESIASLLDEVRAFSGRSDFDDDVSVVAIEIGA